MNLTRTYDSLLERYGNGGMSRRSFLRNVGTLAVVNGIVGSSVLEMISPAHAKVKSVRFDGFGGTAQKSMNDYLLTVFEKETGIVVNQGSFGNEQELLAKLAAEGTGDYNFFTAANPSTALLFVERGYTQTFDPARLPGLANLMEPAVEMYRGLSGTGMLSAVPTNISGVAIAYNHDRIPQAEVEAAGFNILLSKNYPGRIVGEDQWQRRICYGALQTNQDINDIKDMQAVWDKIAECKRNVFKFWRSNAEHSQLLASGETWLTDAWYGPIGQLRKAGLPISYWPNQGTFCNFGGFLALKGTDLDAAHEMASILLRPETLIAQSLLTTNVPALNPKKVALPQEISSAVGFDPTGTLDGYRMLNPQYWNSNAAEWQRQYRRVIERA